MGDTPHTHTPQGTHHFCNHCHGYKMLQKYVNMSGSKPYPNKLKIEEYPQCKGGTDCRIGIPHLPNGMEFGLGCAKCAEADAEQPKSYK